MHNRNRVDCCSRSRVMGCIVAVAVFGCGTSPAGSGATGSSVGDGPASGDVAETTDSGSSLPDTEPSGRMWWGVAEHGIEVVGTPLCREDDGAVSGHRSLAAVDGELILMTYELGSPADVPLLLRRSAGEWEPLVSLEETPGQPRLGVAPRRLGPNVDGRLVAYDGGPTVWIDVGARTYTVDPRLEFESMHHAPGERVVALDRQGNAGWIEQDGGWTPVERFEGIQDASSVAGGAEALTVVGRLGLVATWRADEAAWRLERAPTTESINSIVQGRDTRLIVDAEGALFESTSFGDWQPLPDWRHPSCRGGTRLRGAPDGSLFIVWDDGLARYAGPGSVEVLVDLSSAGTCRSDSGRDLLVFDASAETGSSVYLVFTELEREGAACAEYVLWWQEGGLSWL